LEERVIAVLNFYNILQSTWRKGMTIF